MPVFDLTNDMQLITARSLNDIYSERLGTDSSSDLRINATHGNYMTLLLLRLPVLLRIGAQDLVFLNSISSMFLRIMASHLNFNPVQFVLKTLPFEI